MFNNQQNNNRDLNINTRGIQFMNKNGFDPSTLVIGFWNEMLSIKIHPALDKEKQTESKVFDYEKVVHTALTAEKISTLKTLIENKIFPAISKGEDKKVGVPVGGDSLVVVGTGKDMTGEIRPYIAIHKSLNEETHIPEMSIFYEFNQGMSIEDFDVKTGAFNVNRDNCGEFILFYEVLKSVLLTLSNSTVHSIRYADRFYRNRVINDLTEIATKLGVNKPQRSSGGYRRDIFNGGGPSNNSSNGNDLADMESLNDLNDIDGYFLE